MFRRSFLASAAALAATPSLAQVPAGARTRVVFWHAMNAPLGDEVNKLVAAFNASQTETEIVPVFKGTYPETRSPPPSPPTARARRRIPRAGVRGRHRHHARRRGPR